MSANKIFKSEPAKVDNPNKNEPSPEAVKFEKRKDRSFVHGTDDVYHMPNFRYISPCDLDKHYQ